MQNSMKEAGMKPIRFEFGGFVTAVFERAAEAFEENGGINGGINPILEYIKINPGLRLPAISQGLEMPDKTVEKKIKALKQEGKIEYRGSKKTGGYYAK